MRREFECDVVTGRPYVQYREAITKKATYDYLHVKINFKKEKTIW
jgi:translation elongation factor EF-G